MKYILFCLFCISTFNSLISQNGPFPILDPITDWHLNRDGSFYGYFNSGCGQSKVFYYDQHGKKKWEFLDTTERGYLLFNHFYVSKNEAEVIFESWIRHSDDVFSAASIHIFRVDSSGQVISKIFFTATDLFNEYDPVTSFDFYKDSIVYFGILKRGDSYTRVFKLNKDLKIIDSIKIESRINENGIKNAISDLFYSQSKGLFFRFGGNWYNEKKSDSVYFTTVAYNLKFINESNDSILWVYSPYSTHISRLNKNSLRVEKFDCGSLFKYAQYLSVGDTTLTILGNGEEENVYKIAKFYKDSFKFLNISWTLKNEVPILTGENKNGFYYVTIESNSRYVVKIIRDGILIPPKLIDLSLDSMKIKVLDTFSIFNPYTNLSIPGNEVSICGLVRNHTALTDTILYLNTDFYYGFNCGGFGLYLNHTGVLTPFGDTWICDTFKFYHEEGTRGKICISIGPTKIYVDSINSNNQYCLLISPTYDLSGHPSLVEVFPNPGTSVIHIKSSILFETYQIFSVTGQLISDSKYHQADDIYIGDLTPGFYFLKLSSKGNSIIRKILKQ